MAKANLDKVHASNYGNIETVIATVDLPNGSVVALGDDVDGNREAMHAVAPAADKELLLVVAPEVEYDNKVNWDEYDRVNKAEVPVRAYHLTQGDKFQVELALFDVEPAKNAIVTGAANYGYTAATGTEQTKFIVERLTRFGWDSRKMALLRVL